MNSNGTAYENYLEAVAYETEREEGSEEMPVEEPETI